jgi:hypothetical protein
VKVSPFRKPPWWVAYSFVIATGLLFLISWGLQFYFQAAEFAADAEAHEQGVFWSEFLAEFFASTFENWQSEFLQAAWTVFGLSVFYHWGSAESREQSDRLEAKLDRLLRRHGMDPDADC